MDDLKEQLQNTLSGSYTLERELGGGGMSRVFAAEETSLGRKVVIKVLPPNLAAAVNLERFRREIQVAARLQHAHIVPVLAAGSSDGLPYYTMPFIEGETLRARIAKQGELPIHEAGKILRDVLSALSYAHDHGVIHRDIKPDNVLLSGGHALVADFGVAKALSASTNPGNSLTSMGVALGTPAYMAPEQAAGDPATDHRADLYAAGAIAYEMLTGYQLFSVRSPQQMLAAHAVETPEPIQKRRPSVPPLLASLVMRALEKRPADRPQTASEMLAHVEAALTPSGATAPYSGAMAPVKKSFSVPKPAMITAGAAILLLGAGAVYWSSRDRSPTVTTAEAAAATPSLAVLPFENLGRSEDSYFADGMTEEISSRLGELSGLRVIGRQSVRGYANSTKSIPQIGKELGVTYILAGSVRWDRSEGSTSRVRVTPVLLRADDGTQVWSQPYEDEVTGVFQIQSTVAQRVASALQLRLSTGEQQSLGARPTSNVEAYDNFLRGNALVFSQRGSDYLRAAALFAQAVKLDPQFAQAYAAMANAHVDAYWFRADRSPRRLELAKAAADAALKLAPNLPDAHNALGNYYYHGKLDYERALAEFSIAQRLDPNDPEASQQKAFVERRRGQWTEALADLRRSVELDPRNFSYHANLAETLYFIRDFAAADSAAERTLAINPAHIGGYFQKTNILMARSADVRGVAAVLREAKQKVDPGEYATLLWGLPWPVSMDRALRSEFMALGVPSADDEKPFYLLGRMEMALLDRNPATIRSAANAMIEYLPGILDNTFFDSDVHAFLALAYAGLGNAQRALEEGRESMRILPVSRDALRASVNLVAVARSAAIVGDYDTAFRMYDEALRIPSTASTAFLRADPLLEGLRRDPRFEQMLARHR